MSNTYRNERTGTFRFDFKAIGVRDESTRRSIRREARRRSKRSGRAGRCYGRAKLLTVEQISRVIDYLRTTSRVPESDVLKVRLSYLAGLRACEIAELTVDDVTDASGNVGKVIHVSNKIAKGGHGRIVEMHPKVREAIEDFRKAYPNSKRLAISSRRGREQSANAIAAWFWHLYRRLGYHGCSSHSGRRWYITELARQCGQFGLTLVDVQQMAGHARLDSTQAYIEPYSENVIALVEALGGGEVPETKQGLETYIRAREIQRRIDRQRAEADRRSGR